MQIRIAELSPEDLSAVTHVHQAAFPQSALTRLGGGAVRRYYDWLLRGPHDCTALGAWIGTDLAGFCFGGKFRGALSGFLRKHRAYLAWRVVTHPWLIGLPEFRERLQIAERIFRRRKAASPAPAAAQLEDSFGILAIATLPQFQGQGVGRALMQASQERATAQGYLKMHLTVAVDNTQAIRFYEGLGWKKHTSPDAEWKGLMVIELIPSSGK